MNLKKYLVVGVGCITIMASSVLFINAASTNGKLGIGDKQYGIGHKQYKVDFKKPNIDFKKFGIGNKEYKIDKSKDVKDIKVMEETSKEK